MAEFEDQLVKNRYERVIDNDEYLRLLSLVSGKFKLYTIKSFNEATWNTISKNDGKVLVEVELVHVASVADAQNRGIKLDVKNMFRICEVTYLSDEPISFNGILIDRLQILMKIGLNAHAGSCLYFPEVFEGGCSIDPLDEATMLAKWFCGDKEVDPFGSSIDEHLLESSMHLDNQFGRQIGYVDLQTSLQRDVENMNSKLNDLGHSMDDLLRQYRDKFEKMFGDGSNYSILDEVSNLSQRDVKKKGHGK